jgi:hypothetical protein
MNSERPIKLSAKLPKEARLNGLDSIHEQVARHGQAYIIASVVAPEVVERAGGVRQPVLVIDHIEGLPKGALADDGGRLLRRARTDRENAMMARPQDADSDELPSDQDD